MARGYEELKLDGLTLRGVSRGGVETCLMVPELGLMFDVGMCPRGAIKFDRVLVSHGHADHLGGLFYLLSQRSLMRRGAPDVYVPREILEPLQTIAAQWSAIEDFELPVRFWPCDPEQAIALGDGLEALPLRSVHRVASLAYVISRTTQRLRSEFVGRPGPELAQLRRSGVRLTSPESTPILCVSGDTQIELFLGDARVRQSRVLVHEVTAWDGKRDRASTREWGHTHVDEMIACAERFEGDTLVLVHRSLRHSRADAERIVRERFPATIRDKVVVFGY
ncbi:MAG: MBL fold metallo-hydrolase [Myxococcales bacterium FL481]|nr:MAG: MBL fold metallo-hydrolase [Myxococcales bacterium FL481]